MTFKLIAGHFDIKGSRPDGDTISFRPDDKNLLFMLKGKKPDIKKNGTVSVRFEGIDTMELGAMKPFPSEAKKSNLELCGISNGGTSRGYILSNHTGSHGRPIAFVYLGDAGKFGDDKDVWLDTFHMKKSVNYEQLKRGHAFPMFYYTLYADLRKELVKQTSQARKNKQNVWSQDVTNKWVTWKGSLNTLPPLFPKLWRRLQRYIAGNPNSLSEFNHYLRSRKDRVFIVSENKETGFDDVVEISNKKFRMKYLPEDMIFI